MLSWMQEYWYLCLIAFVIGLITAAWIWLWVEAEADYDGEADADIMTPAVAAPVMPAPKIEPIKPVVPEAKPVTFTAPKADHIPAPAPAPAPVAAPAPAPVAAAEAGKPRIRAAIGAPDDLELIKGVGPKLNKLLISLGVTRFDQIAAFTGDEIAEVDQYLGSFKGRIQRDNWVEQAGYLASGNTAAFEAKYGALGSEIKKG
jgi:predicted flap endonuclease-1-like 5' DNA nuclease